MVDLAQALSEIKSLPDQALQQELASPSGMIPGYLVLGEMHERKRLRASTGPAPTQRPSMAEEYIGSARKAFAGAGLAGQSRPPELPLPPPRQRPMQQGLGSVPPQGMQAPQGYADGGIVGLPNYAEGGKVESRRKGLFDLGEWLGLVEEPPDSYDLIDPEVRIPPAYTDPETGKPASRSSLFNLLKFLGLEEETGYAEGGIVGLPNYARGGVVYSNQQATRNQQLTENLYRQLNDALANVYGPDYGLQVYSGGQPSEGPGRVGSHRHDLGRAADVYIVDPSGNRLTGDALAPIAEYWRSRGIGGVGLEMAGGGVHLDEWATPPQGGGMVWTYGKVTPAQQAALYGGGGSNTLAGSAGGDTLGQGMTIEQYIRARAPVYGVDPDIAVQVAQREGGLNDWVRQSEVMKGGAREQSYGPFQLYMQGGLGNRALAAGIDPRDPTQAWKGVDFALAEAGNKGWGQWYGWKGDPMAGISGQGSRVPIYDMNPMTAAASGAAQASGIVGQQAAETAGQMAAAESADPMSAMLMLNKLGSGQPQPQAAPAMAQVAPPQPLQLYQRPTPGGYTYRNRVV